ncbi:hypothetical protein JVU11DRAFT_5369 [Chiua virens]|nr:hypothetical protein JVU11DRAFT_5369 [Chiua virens]
MGMKYRRYLAGERIYGCLKCKTHLATIHSMISRAFNGQHGRAYLFDGVVNVVEGEPNDRQMTTGNHTVRDIYCVKCATTLGWKYVIEHMNLPRNTKRESTFSSATCLSTFNECCYESAATPERTLQTPGYQHPLEDIATTVSLLEWTSTTHPITVHFQVLTISSSFTTYSVTVNLPS